MITDDFKQYIQQIFDLVGEAFTLTTEKHKVDVVYQSDISAYQASVWEKPHVFHQFVGQFTLEDRR